jgi:hypothetical protein
MHFCNILGRVYLRFEKYMQQVTPTAMHRPLSRSHRRLTPAARLQPLPANKFGPGDVVAMKRQQVLPLFSVGAPSLMRSFVMPPAARPH